MNSQPASRACAGDALVILADPGVDRQRRADAEAAVQVEEAPDADPHPVFVPRPVRHVGQQHLAGRRRQHLPRHRPRDVPDFEIDDRPDDDAGAARQLAAAGDRRSPKTGCGRAGSWRLPFSPIAAARRDDLLAGRVLRARYRIVNSREVPWQPRRENASRPRVVRERRGAACCKAAMRSHIGSGN